MSERVLSQNNPTYNLLTSSENCETKGEPACMVLQQHCYSKSFIHLNYEVVQLKLALVKSDLNVLVQIYFVI